jgi:hypothetical protein
VSKRKKEGSQKMGIIVSGHVFEFVVFIIIYILLFGMLELARRGIYIREVRPLPPVEAIPEAIGRCAELGRPAHMYAGGDISDSSYAAMTMAGLTILSRVAEECGKLGVYLRVTHRNPDTLPAVLDLVRAGYIQGGRPELYTDQVDYVAGQRTFMVRAMDYITREKVAASFIAGASYWETINLIGAAGTAGAMQIGGTPRIWYQSFMMAMMDYPLIVEEMFAAAAMIDGSPPSLGSLAAQDYIKFVSMILIVVAAIAHSAGLGFWDTLIAL